MKSINVTQKHQEDLLTKMVEIRNYAKKYPDHQSIIKSIDEIDDYIRNRKFGLVIENHLEEIEKLEKKGLFELREIKEKNIPSNNVEHILIEGENLIALKIITQKYSGKIKLICIDPPYNTGNYTLNYNDSAYYNSQDKYVHSKWLSFMKKRMFLAYNLLSPTGVMIINIDENQIGGLILLCHQIFQEENVDVLIWPKTDAKFDTNRIEKPFRNIKIIHEYVVLCFKNRSKTKLNQMNRRPNHSSFDSSENKYPLESILNELGTTASAKDEIENIFGDRTIFSTPKPMKMLKEFIRVATDSDSIILDFFAGSGTTGHALMALNKEEISFRKCILITNNENDICQKVTYERLKRVINANLYKQGWKYLKLIQIASNES
jgi:adenine specific DNA methylase Mod